MDQSWNEMLHLCSIDIGIRGSTQEMGGFWLNSWTPQLPPVYLNYMSMCDTHTHTQRTKKYKHSGCPLPDLCVCCVLFPFSVPPDVPSDLHGDESEVRWVEDRLGGHLHLPGPHRFPRYLAECLWWKSSSFFCTHWAKVACTLFHMSTAERLWKGRMIM